MIPNPIEQLDLLGSGPIVGAVINDQQGFPLISGKSIEEAVKPNTEGQQKTTPIGMRPLEQIIGRILAEGYLVVDDNTTEKVLSLRRAKRTQVLSKSERCTRAVYEHRSDAAWLKRESG